MKLIGFSKFTSKNGVECCKLFITRKPSEKMISYVGEYSVEEMLFGSACDSVDESMVGKDISFTYEPKTSDSGKPYFCKTGIQLV